MFVSHLGAVKQRGRLVQVVGCVSHLTSPKGRNHKGINMNESPVWHGHVRNMHKKSKDLAMRAAEIIDTYAGRVTLRQVYYQLVSANVIANSENEYKRLGDILVSARKAGIIRWDSIEDRGRSIESATTWASLNDFRSDIRSFDPVLLDRLIFATIQILPK